MSIDSSATLHWPNGVSIHRRYWRCQPGGQWGRQGRQGRHPPHWFLSGVPWSRVGPPSSLPSPLRPLGGSWHRSFSVQTDLTWPLGELSSVKWYFLGDTNQLWGEYLPVSVTFSGAHTTMINIGQLHRVRCQHYLDNEHIYTISIDWWQCQYVYLLYIRGPPRGLVSRLRHAYCMLAVWRYCGILMFSSDHVLVNLSRPPSAYLYCSILLHAALHKSLKRRLKTKVREDFTIMVKAPTFPTRAIC